MRQKVLDGLWNDYERARQDLGEVKRSVELSRDALVSHYCGCYVDGEQWEDRAVWCSLRASGTCAYYIELKRRRL